MPGGNATLVDLPPTSPGGFVKPMVIRCRGDASATIPTAAGIGPVLGFIQPIGKEKLIFEFMWLPELETKSRSKGDYLWLKMVYTF